MANGPGGANPLYSNQLMETGTVTFIDVGVAAGVDATDQDSAGVCYGDIDNDGDHDLFVVATGEANRMFENNGDGTFTDITAVAGVAGDGRHAVACSFGDVNNDGLLDVVVGNSFDDWNHRLPVFSSAVPIYEGMEHNYLFLNTGGNVFADVSGPSGIESCSNMDGPGLTGASFTWAIGMWDYNMDGAIDIHYLDNQGGSTVPIGLHRIYRNDGTGNFTEVTADVGLGATTGGWMGLSVADFDCNGYLDFFSTDLGSYLGAAPSRAFYQQPDGTFVDQGVAATVNADPFGWGTSPLDYDNDGDTDVVYHGSVDLLNLIVADNPGVIFRNRAVCSGRLDWDSEALTTDHRFRNVQGVATGDLDNNGFVDIVTVSNFNIVEGNPNFLPYTLITGPLGSPFDALVRFQNILTSRIVPGSVVPVEPFPELPDGTLAVELNSGGNGNGWLQVDTMGTVGLISGGQANRDGIGAVVSVRPVAPAKPRSMLTVSGGASYASQDSLTAEFGLGDSARAHVEVLWPGGVRNRLYNVAAGTRLRFPEIPCSFADTEQGLTSYLVCMFGSLDELVDAGIITGLERLRLLVSGVRAYNSEVFAGDEAAAEEATRRTLVRLGLQDVS